MIETSSDESLRIDEELKSVNRLQFKNESLEDSFQKQFVEENVHRHRICLIIGIVAIFIFLIQDLAIFPSESLRAYLIIRLGICLPFLILAYLVNRSPNMRRHTTQWILSAVLVFGLGTVAIIALNHMHNHESPYEGVLLMIMATYFLVGLDFRTASLCSLLITASYTFFVLADLPNIPDGSYNLSFLALTIIIGAGGGYSIEKQLRINYLNNKKLSLLSETDGLTGLLNRSALELKLHQAILSTQRDKEGMLVCLIDIDSFKQYNDHYGHPSGDAIIQAVGLALQRCCKRPLDFCARYGGEEFALVWHPTSHMSVTRMIETVQHEIADLKIPHAKSKVAKFITVSGGVAYVEPRETLTNSQVLEWADEALYDAKNSGRNQFKVVSYAAKSEEPELDLKVSSD